MKITTSFVALCCLASMALSAPCSITEQATSVQKDKAAKGFVTIQIDYVSDPPVIKLIQKKWYSSNHVSLLRTGSEIRLAPGRKLLVSVIGQNKGSILVNRAAPNEGTTTSTIGPDPTRSAGNVQAFSHETELTVPASGMLSIVCNPDVSKQTARTIEFLASPGFHAATREVVVCITPAERWEFDDTFAPQIAFSAGESPKFAAANTPIVFGENRRIRLDAIAAFDPDGNESFLGQALTYSMYLGSTYKESGKGTFRFPVRVNLSLGVQSWSFDQKSFGSGRPFVAFGISIPASKIG